MVLLRREMSNVLRKVVASDSICKVRSRRVSLSCRTSHLSVSFVSEDSSFGSADDDPSDDDATPTNSTKFRIVSQRNLNVERYEIMFYILYHTCFRTIFLADTNTSNTVDRV